MKKTLAILLLLSATGSAFAVDGGAVLGGVIGGATGAAVGQSVGGRNGAILGAAIGGGTGAAIGSSNSTRAVGQAPVIRGGEYREDRRHRHGHEDREDRGHDRDDD